MMDDGKVSSILPTLKIPQAALKKNALLSLVSSHRCTLHAPYKRPCSPNPHFEKNVQIPHESVQSSRHLSDNFDNFYVLFLFMAFEEALMVGLVETVT